MRVFQLVISAPLWTSDLGCRHKTRAPAPECPVVPIAKSQHVWTSTVLKKAH